MINFLNFPIQIQKNNTLKQTHFKRRIANNFNKINRVSDIDYDPSKKILFLQIKAMAEQDNRNSVGKILDILV